MKKLFLLVIIMTTVFSLPRAEACTGITLTTIDSTMVTARTIEWNVCYRSKRSKTAFVVARWHT